jgi:hypothetical protein
VIQTLHERLKTLEGLVGRALDRIRRLEADNKRLASELAFHEKEAARQQDAARRARALAEASDRAQRRLRRLRDRLERIEQTA